MRYIVRHFGETIAMFYLKEHALAFAHQNLQGVFDYYEIIDLVDMSVIEEYIY